MKSKRFDKLYRELAREGLEFSRTWDAMGMKGKFGVILLRQPPTLSFSEVQDPHDWTPHTVHQ